jgi:ribosomal protein S18 acetylase RimI-like enzyme
MGGMAKMMKPIAIRPATPEGAQIGADLIYLSGPEIFRYLFVDDAARCLAILRAAFPYPGHMFSHQLAQFAEVNGEVLGIMLGYRGRDEQAEAATGTLLKDILSPQEMEGWIQAGTTMEEIRPRPLEAEFYVQHLAVTGPHQSKGIGAQLLARTGDYARKEGSAGLSLDVEIENTRAIAFYERGGFTMTATFTHESLKRVGITGMHRMVKPLV